MSADKTSKAGDRFHNIFRALESRNGKLYFSGQGLSLIGTWMTRLASAWLVYRLTNDAFLLGLLGFAGQIPTFLLAPFAGVWIDRWERKKTLVVTQVAAMIQSFALALVVYLKFDALTTVWLMIFLNVVQGIINAFDTPARQAFLVDIIPKRESLPNAIALNSSMVHMARLIGPTIAGILIGFSGEMSCFFLDGVSYVAVVSALLVMKVAPRPRESKNGKKIWQDLQDGFKYAFGFAPIKAILLIISLMALMGMPHTVLMPIIAKKILGGDAKLLGYLNACSGVGALTGAIYLASRSSVVGLGKVMAQAAFVFSIALMVFAVSKWTWLSAFVLLFTGYGLIILLAAGNTILQTLVEDDKRGRVMSLYTTAFLGMSPFGSLLAGTVAKWIGTPDTLFIGGVCCLVGAILFRRSLPLLRLQARPVYVQKGIIKDIATGLETASNVTKAVEE